MGSVSTITYDKFPSQGKSIGMRVTVCYDYDTTKRHQGTIVRDDIEDPWLTLFKLDNGRYILSTECQYAYIKETKLQAS